MSRPEIKMIGKKFGRLTVIGANGKNKHRQNIWKCRCDCGNILIVVGGALRNGHSKSCGCLCIERVREKVTTHGMHGTPTYKAWAAMKQRCNNPKEPSYKNYGGRGIRICEKWITFENFLSDMGECPDGLTLERNNNAGDYCKENCSWESWVTQARNKRIRSDNSTGVKGIHFCSSRNVYHARITTNKKTLFIGSFNDLEDAATARRAAEKRYWK